MKFKPKGTDRILSYLKSITAKPSILFRRK